MNRDRGVESKEEDAEREILELLRNMSNDEQMEQSNSPILQANQDTQQGDDNSEKNHREYRD